MNLSSKAKIRRKETEMEWDSQAVAEFIKMPLVKVQKENSKVFAEKVARRNGSDKVTLKEMEETKKVDYASVPEEARLKELEKRIAEGETDLRERMIEEAKDILAREIDLFGVNLCHAQYFRCRNQNIEVRELKKEVEQKLRELKVTEMVADLLPDGTRIMPHDRFSVSISACSNSCTGAEVSSFGVTGMAKPMVTDTDCSECFTCVDGCARHAILIRNGKPEIDITKCDCCGACVKACPNSVFAFEDTGYRIFIGGASGRFHQTAHELFKIANKETLFRVLEASIELIREKSLGEESLPSIINRVGIAPIFQKLYSVGGKNE
jgi:dissimilatory sulfite reductase (desulfoviridin) alpha/beta subunit